MRVDDLSPGAIMDQILGPVPTMPIEALVDRLEKAAPRLQKALTAWAKWYSARLDRINNGSSEDYTGYEQDLFEALGCSTEPFGPPCPVCRGRKVIQGAFETVCHNCKGTGLSPSIPREAWKGLPLGECCIAGRCDGPTCACPCHPNEPRPFNNDDPNDGSFKRFTCKCGTCIEVTPTWRTLHNDSWWIETFCSEKCGWKARGTTLRGWAEDAEKR